MKLHITIKDILLILFLFFLYSTVGYASFNIFGKGSLVPLIVTISVTLLGIMFELYRRLYDKSSQLKQHHKQHYKQLRIQQENNYTQIESAFSLFFTIKPDLPLPNMRGWAASPDFLKRIVYEVLSRKPNLIVEASSGISTLIIAYSLKKNGHGRVISLEDDKKYFNKTKELIRNHCLDEYSTPVYAPLEKVTVDGRSFDWYNTDSLKLESAIDMLIIDGPKASLQDLSRYPALPKFYETLSENAIILLDDGERRDEKEIVKLWESKYPDICSEYVDFEKGGFILSKKSL